MNVGDLVERNARLFGRRLAIVFGGVVLTHADFAERVFALGGALLDRGLRRQARIGILMRNRIEALEAMYAASCAGLIGVSLNWRLSPPELAKIVRDCEPDALVYEAEFADAVEAILPIADVNPLKIMTAKAYGAESDYERLFIGARKSRPEVSVGDEDIESLVYTSGTTGDAKGVMLSHRAMVGAAASTSWEGGVLPTDRVMIVMPLFHVGGKIEQMAFWIAGACTHLRSQFDAASVLAQIRDERITAAHLAPTMIAMLVDRPEVEWGGYGSLRLVHYASAPMPIELLRRALKIFGPIFVQLYGMTECVLGTSLKPHQHGMEADAEAAGRLSSAGQPCLGVDLRIERDDGSSCRTGEPGEVLLKGVALMSGYWNRNALTIAALRDGWMRTGDIGYIDEEGFLFIVDRKKDMIISGGENIYSREVEEALSSHSSVKEAAVVGAPDRKWGEIVFAFVVLEPGKPLPVEDLIAHCRERVASYKKPRFVRAIDALPRIHNGKIDKKLLREMAREAVTVEPKSDEP